MRKRDLKYIIIAFILLIGQGLIDSFIHISLYIHLSVLPYIILAMPYRNSTISNTTTAFVIGIIADILGGGILGLNTAALTAAGFAKKGLVGALINKDLLEKESRPTPQITGLGRYAVLATFIILIYLGVYLAVESIGSWSWMLNILRMIFSFAVNLFITIGLFIICNPRRQ